MSDHDLFECDCHETCSRCLEPVKESSLRDDASWGRVCAECRSEIRAEKASR